MSGTFASCLGQPPSDDADLEEIVTLDLSEGYWRHVVFEIPTGQFFELAAWMRVRGDQTEPAAESTLDGRPSDNRLLLMYLLKEDAGGTVLWQMRSVFQSVSPADRPEAQLGLQVIGEDVYAAPSLLSNAAGGGVGSTQNLNGTRLPSGIFHFLAIGKGNTDTVVEISLPHKTIQQVRRGNESALSVEPRDLNSEAGAMAENDVPFTQEAAFIHLVNGTFEAHVEGVGVLVMNPTRGIATGQLTYRYMMPDLESPWLQGRDPDHIVEPEWSHPSETAHRWGGLGPPGNYRVEYRELQCQAEDLRECGGRMFFMDLPVALPFSDRSG